MNIKFGQLAKISLMELELFIKKIYYTEISSQLIYFLGKAMLQRLEILMSPCYLKTT
jgi:hypothetical protein